jgi:hypothetical protein
VDPRVRSTHRRSCSRAGDEVTAQRRTFEVDAVCTVDDAIEDGVAEGRIADHLMPAIHGDLAGDQQRPAIAARSTLNRMVAGRDCAPLPTRQSTRSAAP